MRQHLWKKRCLAVLLAGALGMTLAGCSLLGSVAIVDRGDVDVTQDVNPAPSQGVQPGPSSSPSPSPSPSQSVPQYLTCDDCGGAGEVLCVLCDGVGWQIWFEGGPQTTCSLCSGTGYARCVTCGGTGQVENPAYTGGGSSSQGSGGTSGSSGNVYVPTVPLDPGFGDVSVMCPVCSGTGEKLCSGCSGTGEVSGIEYVPDYGLGGGGTYYSEKMCRQCNGSGRVPCTACGGTGYQ